MPFLQLLTAFTVAITGIFHPGIKTSQKNNQVLAAAIHRLPTVTPFIPPFESPTIVPPITHHHAISEHLIDCIGPDGKHLQVTQQTCENFNHACHQNLYQYP
jgi:hypothetical protein